MSLRKTSISNSLTLVTQVLVRGLSISNYTDNERNILSNTTDSFASLAVGASFDGFVGKLADTLFDQELQSPPVHLADLHNITVGRHTHTATPYRIYLRPFDRHPHSVPCAFAAFTAGYLPQLFTRLRRDFPLRATNDIQTKAPSDAVGVAEELGHEPSSVAELLQLSYRLLQLNATPLALFKLTDAINYPIEQRKTDTPNSLARIANSLKRLRRSQLLLDLLKSDRTAYINTVSLLNIPRAELPNRQEVPLRVCDTDLRRPDAVVETDLVGGLNADGLVPDCILQEKSMGENFVEAWLLEITRNIYSEETGVGRNLEKGIRGLLEEMRKYMLSPRGVAPAAQQEGLIRTLRRLMTPFLPPFYRIFMGGIVPSYDPDDKRVGADPKWLADGVQWVRNKLPVGKEYFEPGRQLGPWFYAPTLTAAVAPYAFGFLVGPSKLNFRSDGQLGGLVVEKCKFLQESNCKGMCLNSCKLPAQQLFDELGLPLRVSPNFATQECQWSFGEKAPPPEEDPTWPKGCLVGCTSREAIKELRRACE